ncbi:MAG: hypothetical protein LBQ24_02510 [Candidatus Peribacteria bacterium]|nr:hypothetical protein [Candidatus Peribacteria bacterium]
MYLSSLSVHWCAQKSIITFVPLLSVNKEQEPVKFCFSPSPTHQSIFKTGITTLNKLILKLK